MTNRPGSRPAASHARAGGDRSDIDLPGASHAPALARARRVDSFTTFLLLVILCALALACTEPSPASRGESTAPAATHTPLPADRASPTARAATTTPDEAAASTPAASPQTSPEGTPTTVVTSTPVPSPSGTRAAAPQATTSATAIATAASSPTPEGVARRLEVHVRAVPSDIPRYDRHDWKHWNDADRDCQNARQEVLIAESLAPVGYADDRDCRVTTGSWVGPYTGETFGEAGDLDVDHMVPLGNAHLSGGWSWDAERRELYANDLSYPDHLIAVQARANRAKGARGPEEWKPPLRSYWCEYAIDWIVIKNHWGLTVTEAELTALQEMLDTCEASATLARAPGSPVNPAPAPDIATPVPDASATPDLPYDPAGPDRDCGDFEGWRQAQAFYEAAGGPADDRHRLDPDGDGVACESLPGAP